MESVLTPNIVKRELYGKDVHFEIAANLVQGFWSDTSCRTNHLWNCAALLLRPDAIAGRKARRVFPMLREHGFVPIVVRPVCLAASQTEALWKYQFNVSTPERRHLLMRLMAIGSSVFTIVRDESHRASAPATVHLTYLKGTAVLANRRRGHLRTLAGPPIASVFSYVHVSDDPADMLREMSVLFSASTQLEILSEIQAGVDRTSTALNLIRDLEALTPEHALFPSELHLDDGPSSAGEQVLRREWHALAQMATNCGLFVAGDSYDSNAATIPDGRELSLPLDAHLIVPELGPW